MLHCKSNNQGYDVRNEACMIQALEHRQHAHQDVVDAASCCCQLLLECADKQVAELLVAGIDQGSVVLTKDQVRIVGGALLEPEQQQGKGKGVEGLTFQIAAVRAEDGISRCTSGIAAGTLPNHHV